MARVRGIVLFGSLVAIACADPLAACGDPNDLGSAGAIAPDSVAAITIDGATVETAAPPTTLQSESSTVPPTSVDVVPADTALATTTIVTVMTPPPTMMLPTPEASDASVRALAAVLGVVGELEQHDGEHGSGQCIGRLEPRGLCVNVPLWGVWQYWDLGARESWGERRPRAQRRG